ncbi:uncharacterized protein DUF397 [Stackebrandtia endophytica]|uniref:Uncharacterized protein DUF397 n=1 Tax=Stackebrandtia endophytica TaxID=1496996 RepID=A0A543AZ33_9ACTN|nr:DUF397 domain-containing protein [Stackebrandtia endophytica]TQL77834.1 uncharacterized protein DUF397 [Stackebrandtia endophytica]
MTAAHPHSSGTIAPLTWRKSSRSSNASAQCVEVGAWRKSSRSGGGQNCVEAGACTCHGVAIRDTKHHASGTLSICAAEWGSLVVDLKRLNG